MKYFIPSNMKELTDPPILQAKKKKKDSNILPSNIILRKGSKPYMEKEDLKSFMK